MKYTKRVYHGMSKTRQYNIYRGIIKRCGLKTSQLYKHYGGRGIICEWRTFTDFWNDMKDTYEEHLTIERIDNDGNYCKSNCKWETIQKQNFNKRNSLYYKGKTAKQWCEELGLKYNTFHGRLNRGYTINKALGL